MRKNHTLQLIERDNESVNESYEFIITASADDINAVFNPPGGYLTTARLVEINKLIWASIELDLLDAHDFPIACIIACGYTIDDLHSIAEHRKGKLTVRSRSRL